MDLEQCCLALEGCGSSQPSLEALKNDGAKRLAPSRDSACNGISPRGPAMSSSFRKPKSEIRNSQQRY